MIQSDPEVLTFLQTCNDAVDNVPLGASPEYFSFTLIAAALRAISEMDEVKPDPVGEQDESYGSWSDIMEMSESDFRYHMACAVKQSQIAAYRKIRKIADLLDENL